MSIRKATAPNLISQPDVRLFRKDDFEAAIWAKGYDVLIEKAIVCPCKGLSGAPKTTCQNCLGLGWVFINPFTTRALVSSINRDTKFQQWSPEMIGTISITVRDEERFHHMDKVTFTSRTGLMSEVRKVLWNDDQAFIFCSYKVEYIKSIVYFTTDGAKLTVVSQAECSINPDNRTVVLLNNEFPEPFNGVVSIEYAHKVSYNIVDLPHDFRSTFMMNSKGQNIEYNMPIQAIARRSHFVFGESTNYAGTNLLNNDTL